MIVKPKFKKATVLKLILISLAIILTILFFFKDRIAEHKVTKAKMEMFRRMYKSPPEEWDDEFKQVFDSLIIEKIDSIKID